MLACEIHRFDRRSGSVVGRGAGASFAPAADPRLGTEKTASAWGIEVRAKISPIAAR